MRQPKCFLIAIALLTPLNIFSQNSQPIELQRLTESIELDGLSFEPAWETIEPLPLTMYLPVFQGQSSERTEIRVAYDDEFIYASGRFYDNDPSGIRINSLYRDRWSGDDAFAIYIDPLNDNENALWFMTTPAGIRSDIALSGDAEGTDNPSWNTFWDVATKVTGEGWFAEMRIPLSSLRFQESDGRVVMGLTVTRYIARKNERVTFPSIEPKYAFRKPSVAQDVVLSGIHSRKPVYVTPYALGGLARSSQLNNDQTKFNYQRDYQNDIGADVKYTLSDNLTLDLTANTDFAQVEADDRQVNLTRFSLFFPEKRQFFQERSSLFDFNMGHGNRLLHTRRIGLTDQGEPVRILGGARLVGRAGLWNIGFINMQTEKQNASTPSENFGVLRLKHPVFNSYSYAGGMMTSRIDQNGHYSLAYGLDGTVRVAGDEYLTLKWSQSLQEDYIKDNGFRPLETGQMYATWARRTIKGLSYSAQFARAGSQYDPGIGFVQHSDFTFLQGVISYTLFPQSETLRNHSWNNVTILRFRNDDNKLESSYFAPWWDFETKSGATGWIEPRWQYENVPDTFQLSEKANVPSGRYHFFDMWLNYKSAPGGLLYAEGDAIIGTFYDGWRYSFSLSPTWRISKHLELGGTYDIDIIRFSKRDQSFTSHLGRLKIQTAVNARFSAQAYVQLSTAAHVVGANTIIRYNVSEGTDLWIVYNHNLNTDRMRQQPALPLTSSNVLIVKYTHTFTL
ncbi:carbohydrate binding family 9 domain-containing protein [bacterium]|nr:carbohydrate binding family 9 domain-containing protein [bacterium]